jgi:hypothetical protein
MAHVICKVCDGNTDGKATIVVSAPFVGDMFICWNCAVRIAHEHRKKVMVDGSGYYPRYQGGAPSGSR